MTRWFQRVGMVLALVTVPALAPAQTGRPSPVGAARMPDPASRPPLGPPPDLRPGPITPDIAPFGPPAALSLPENHAGAFQDENCRAETAFFASLGFTSYRRDRLQRLQTAFRESDTVDRDPFVFYPTLPAAARPAQQDVSDLQPALNYGPRITLGYLEGDQAVEFIGWYLHPGDDDRLTTQGMGSLTVPFGLSRQPLGFVGNNNIFVNADEVSTRFNSQLGSAEFNYRSWNTGVTSTELILGVRYVHSQEELGIFANDELTMLDALGNLNPLNQATYTVTTRNNLAALQIGGEHSAQLPKLGGLVWVTAMGKAGYGPNFIRRRYKVTRGDGLRGFDVQQNDVSFGQIYEVSASLDLHILEKLRFKVGYQALWLGGVSNAGSQVNFDLGNQGTRRVDYNTQFYHGPMAEFQFLF